MEIRWQATSTSRTVMVNNDLYCRVGSWGRLCKNRSRGHERQKEGKTGDSRPVSSDIPETVPFTTPVASELLGNHIKRIHCYDFQ